MFPSGAPWIGTVAICFCWLGRILGHSEKRVTDLAGPAQLILVTGGSFQGVEYTKPVGATTGRM